MAWKVLHKCSTLMALAVYGVELVVVVVVVDLRSIKVITKIFLAPAPAVQTSRLALSLCVTSPVTSLGVLKSLCTALTEQTQAE